MVGNKISYATQTRLNTMLFNTTEIVQALYRA
jgi:hypothetical protein